MRIVVDTGICRRDDLLMIMTKYRQGDYRSNAGFREMAHAYHGAQAMQVLEDAVREGAEYIETVDAMRLYEDAMLAREDAIMLGTYFRMRFIVEKHDEWTPPQACASK